MHQSKILFLGGDPNKYASVQIRCIDVAKSLGIDYALKISDPDQIPARYSMFFCVKAGLSASHLVKLSKRGVVIWDILDAIPPKDGIEIYLASTKAVKESMRHYGRVEQIPHHHCNFSLLPNASKLRRAGWIGGKEWYPKFRGFKFLKCFTQYKTQDEIIATYRKIGIGLNLRAELPRSNQPHPEKIRADFHVSLNSGIKLINCIGFGVPSISSDEIAYREIGDDFTIFSNLRQCKHWVSELKSNDRLYRQLRRNCLKKAPDFQLKNIAHRYLKMIRSA